MANVENLKKGKKTRFSSETAADNGRKGGLATAENKRKKKTMAELALTMLNAKASEEERIALANRYGDTLGEEPTKAAVMIAGQVVSAVGGNTKAFTALMELSEKQEEREAQKEAEKAALLAKDYHTDLDIIADVYHPIVRKIRRKEVREIVLRGGRGSAKSSVGTILPFELMRNNHNIHCIALRQVKDTLRDSIYAQFQWSCDKQAENPMFDRENWDFKLSPLEITYKPTGQKIYFRGADDPGKIKSIKVPFGYIGIVIFEEFDQFIGQEAVRKIEQSVARGGDDILFIKMFNPPISKSNWANQYADEPKDGKIVISTTYKDVPREWLGNTFIEEAEHLQKVNPDAYEHEYGGKPIGIGTEIFKFLEIREITDEEIERQERIYQGQDWGWEPDPKAFIRLSYSHATETVMLIDEDGGTCIRVADMAKRIIDKGYDDYEIRCGVDEIEHINDFRDAGLPAVKAIVKPGSVRRTHEWLQCRKIVIDPKRTPRAYKEFSNYEHEVDKNGDVIDGYPDKNNHWIDAVRYATSPLSMRRGEKA